MGQEFEAKFLGVDKDDLRQRLIANGYQCQYPERLMRRKIFVLPHFASHEYCRVRDEGNKITMTYKHIRSENSIDGVQEAEIQIKDFDGGVEFFEMLGMRQKAYQETKREKWTKGDVEAVIDTWPGLNPIIEVEAFDAETVKRESIALGFELEQALYGTIDVVYEKELGIPPSVINNETPIITFENPPQKYEVA